MCRQELESVETLDSSSLEVLVRFLNVSLSPELVSEAGFEILERSIDQAWSDLKDEPKFHEACAGQSKTINLEDDCYGTPPAGSNQVDTGGDSSTPPSAGNKRPLGRDATKESRKKAASSSSSSEYISKMHDLWADRFSDMKDGRAEKNKYLAQMAALEKEKIDRQVDIEERRLALEARRLDWEERKDESRMLAE
jgi:hypothetical protein